MSKDIRLFWWNERIIQGKEKENYGDLLGKYLVERISGRRVVFAWPKKFVFRDLISPIYVTIGSILTNVNSKCVVWGSGIISKEYKVKKAKFLAVRGPQTRKFLMESGYHVPPVYGDPAILLPRLFRPAVEEKYEYGIVPHYKDYERVREWVYDIPGIKVIDMMTNNIEQTTTEFLQCKRIVSSSLHGIIVPHAYGIPAVWQKFSNDVFGDDIKYRDYFESVGLQSYTPLIRTVGYSAGELEYLFKEHPSLPSIAKLEELRNGLMEVCPFKPA